MWDARDILIVLASYLLGAIPFSYLVGRWRAGIDVRQYGDGNVGARNVYHLLGPTWGTLAASLDAGKGMVAYLMANQLALSRSTVLICGFAAPFGHNFPLFLRFRGGKGVATTIGFLLGLLPLSTLLGVLVILTIYMLTRNMERALNLGLPVMIFLPAALGAPVWAVPYGAFLFLMLGAKKLIDRPYERAIWARRPWRKGRTGFCGEDNENLNRETNCRR